MGHDLRWKTAFFTAAVIACSKTSSDPPNFDPTTDKMPPVAPLPVVATTRWLWVESTGGTYLAFYYVDRSAGPSAKGSRVGESATAAEITEATERPSNTFRDPVAMGARAVTQDEVDTMKLAARPGWLDIFEPAGTPAPALPTVKAAGRPTAPKAGAGGGPMVIQSACGPRAGGVWMLPSATSLSIGSQSAADASDRGMLEGDGVLPTHVVFKNDASGVTLTPAPSAKVLVNNKTVTTATPVSAGDRITIAKMTLIVRPATWTPTTVGPDPSCPGFADTLSIQDGCSIYGSSYYEIIGGGEMIVGNDKPSRSGLAKDYGATSPVRAKLRNEGGKIAFEAVDPQHPPTRNGKPAQKGVLAVGDRITTGDRVFAVATAKNEKGIEETPLPSCPEAAEKKKKADAGY